MVCRYCECTETTPCHDLTIDGPCYWFAPDLCSVCALTMFDPELADDGPGEALVQAYGMDDLRRAEQQLGRLAC